MREEMCVVIEWEMDQREGVTLEGLEAKHIWPEDKAVNPDGFASILAEVQKRIGDWDTAYKEARRIHQERKGK